MDSAEKLKGIIDDNLPSVQGLEGSLDYKIDVVEKEYRIELIFFNTLTIFSKELFERYEKEHYKQFLKSNRNIIDIFDVLDDGSLVYIFIVEAPYITLVFDLKKNWKELLEENVNKLKGRKYLKYKN